MPQDPHLFKGEGDRSRRYARFLIEPLSQTFSVFAHDTFFQDKKFDQLYGDVHRSFAPMTELEYKDDFLQMLILESFRSLPLSADLRAEAFEVSAHMIRIEANLESGIGRPAPEGIHRDGYHFGSIHLMRRTNVSGAENNIYDLQKKLVETIKLEEPMDSIYFDDTAIFHGVSPFAQLATHASAIRDMLILLFQPLSESPQKHTPTQRLRRI